MGDDLEHKCGVAYIRLLKPHSYFEQQYGSPDFLVQRMFFLLTRMRNRGHDGAGIGTSFIPYTDFLDQEYMFRDVKPGPDPVDALFADLQMEVQGKRKADRRKGSAMIGHVLYSTCMDVLEPKNIHPVERHSHYPTGRVLLAMNGNFANNDLQRDFLRGLGKWPTSTSDMQTLAEHIGHYLDEQCKNLRVEHNDDMQAVSEHLDVVSLLTKVDSKLQGAYALVSLIGNGDSFIARDPHGIRKIHYYQNDEIIIAASEVSAITSTFKDLGIKGKDVEELPPGHILEVKASGTSRLVQFSPEIEDRFCQFERVYFQRPNNPGIHDFRKSKGALLADRIEEKLAGRNYVISCVPNSSLSAFLGVTDELRRRAYEHMAEDFIALLQSAKLTEEHLRLIIDDPVTYDFLLTKDQKLRTFILQRSIRNVTIAGAYDTIEDSIARCQGIDVVLVDDSVVKGNTLQKSVIQTVVRPGMGDIYIASTEPMIKDICCYGIEMGRLGELVAFRAMMELITEKGLDVQLESITQDVEREYKKSMDTPTYVPQNVIQKLFALVPDAEIENKIGLMLTPTIEGWGGRVHVLFPTVEALCSGAPARLRLQLKPYCTGCLDADYPEPGGIKASNRALHNYFFGIDKKAY